MAALLVHSRFLVVFDLAGFLTVIGSLTHGASLETSLLKVLSTPVTL
jgi:hypothetical protein